MKPLPTEPTRPLSLASRLGRVSPARLAVQPTWARHLERAIGEGHRPRPHIRHAAGNAAGAAFAAYLMLPNLNFFLQTGRLIGFVFVIQQAWVAVVFLARRPPQTISARPLDWIAAYAGWFTSFLVRPGGEHLAWAIDVGFWVQVAGLLLWAWPSPSWRAPMASSPPTGGSSRGGRTPL
jgi:hypothetical protein